MESSELARRARWAYEKGRLARALPLGGYGVVLVLCAVVLRSSVGSGTLALGAVFTALLVGYGWRGGVLGRAVVPGVLGGVMPLLVPPLVVASGHVCASGCRAFCLLACVGGGVLAGLLITRASSASPVDERGRFVLAAGVLATLCGALTCVLYGVSGVIGLMTGLALASAPGLVLRRA
ncbi:hypothetical protein [Myxococcus sp. RHSTA-1-4]|uniref:hypothetical protein n=1 Tax=Myxococcus sp. RHSTA-1-4 TaxID=2874601 RepID=UPI001CC0672E|nr:hypothetical protein [Myxococcus sp. RHSTA-1-4]MBZ4418718.1 hypothetical protein [Myxococcus sp. RHSTA-1-4]